MTLLNRLKAIERQLMPDNESAIQIIPLDSDTYLEAFTDTILTPDQVEAFRKADRCLVSFGDAFRIVGSKEYRQITGKEYKVLTTPSGNLQSLERVLYDLGGVED